MLVRREERCSKLRNKHVQRPCDSNEQRRSEKLKGGELMSSVKLAKAERKAK